MYHICWDIAVSTKFLVCGGNDGSRHRRREGSVEEKAEET